MEDEELMWETADQRPPQRTRTRTRPRAIQKKGYSGFMKDRNLMIIVMVSIFLFFGGALMSHASSFITNKDYSGDNGTDEMKEDQRTQTTVSLVGNILADIGAALLLVFIVLAGIMRTDWSDTIRFGLLFFAAVFAFGLMAFTGMFRF